MPCEGYWQVWPSVSLRDVQQQAQQRPRSTMSSIGVHHRRDKHDSQDYATQRASKITCSTYRRLATRNAKEPIWEPDASD